MRAPDPAFLREKLRLSGLCSGRMLLALRVLAGCGLVETPAMAGVVTNCTQPALVAALASGGTATYASDCSLTLTNSIRITNTVTLDASGHAVSIQGNNSTRLFTVAPGANLTLKGLTLSTGRNTNGGAVYVSAGATAVFTNCLFAGNSAAGADGAAGSDGSNNTGIGGNGGRGDNGAPAVGGAIYNAGTSTLIFCQFFTNSALGGNGGTGGTGGDGDYQGGNGGAGGNGANALGGAVYNAGNLVATNCSFHGNKASGGNAGTGGAPGSGAFPGLAGNGGKGAQGDGAGFYNTALATIVGCTFATNVAFGGNSAAAGSSSGTGADGPDGADSLGGGFCNLGRGFVTNCTFFGNRVAAGNGGNGGSGDFAAGNGGNGGNGIGGAVSSSGTNYVVNCTLAQNSAVGGTNGVAGDGPFPGTDGRPGRGNGGGVSRTAGSFVLQNSIVATNNPGTNGFGTVTDAGYNLSSDSSLVLGATSRKTNAYLAALQDNGGPTLTIALLTGSAAIDAIPNGAAFPPTDQRGRTRPVPAGGAADMGALEVNRPVILTSPLSQTQSNNGPVTFTVSASGDPPLLYQWRFNGTNISGATQTNYAIAHVAATNAGNYTVMVSNSAGVVTSAVATLTVTFPPVITRQPVSQSVAVGGTASFSVTATGATPLRYQWRFNGANLNGLTSSTLTILSVRTNNAGNYQVVVSNDFGSVTSANALLTVQVSPVIVAGPTDRLAVSNSAVTFNVTAVGTAPLSYQWRFNGANLAGATSSALVFAHVQLTDAGSYRVVVTNVAGAQTSSPATLRVVFPTAIAAPALSATGFAFSIPTQTGFAYVVESKNSLSETNWIPLITNAGTGGSLDFEYSTAELSRFFRVRIQ